MVVGPDERSGTTLACRFSSDMDTVDDDLPFIMNIFLSEAFEMLGTLVVLVISQPLLAAAFVPLAFIYRCIQVLLLFIAPLALYIPS